MKLIAVADIHEDEGVLNWLPNLLPKADGLIVAGDVSRFGGTSYFHRFFKVISTPRISTFYVPGNHDVLMDPKLTNVIALHGKSHRFYNILIGGLGGSKPTPFGTPFEIPDADAESVLSFMPDDLDVLVSHDPPFGTSCDVSSSGEHIGSVPVRKYIENSKPKLVISGHIHESRAQDKIDNTIIVNCGPAKNGNYCSISFEDKLHVELNRV